MNIDEIITSREKFNEFVYTPIDKAIVEITNRQDNKKLDEYIKVVLKDGIPGIMKGYSNGVIFRHIATPNREIIRFLTVVGEVDKLNPIIFEYGHDLFNNRNEWKYSLGKLAFYKGVNKKGEQIVEYKKIIDFNDSNNKSISTIKTDWQQSLIDFHHELFFMDFPQLKDNVYDLSRWLAKYGGHAKDYYKGFLSLFLKNGILFENFLLEGSESVFTKEVILPTILEIERETGLKPIIVALEPTENEIDKFWLSYSYDKKIIVEKNKEL